MERRSHSLQLSSTSLARVDSGAHQTLWAFAKVLGKSTKRQSSFVIENGFPNPFGINAPDPPPDVTEQTSESDPEKRPTVVKFQENSLLPVDGGWGAWSCLLGAATIEGLMWAGYLLAVFYFILTKRQGFLWRSEFFNHTFKSPSLRKQSIHRSSWSISNGVYIWSLFRPWLTFSQGISYVGNPLVTPSTIRYQKYQRHMICIGWLVCIVALLSSSFATKLWHLIVTQGLLYGIGIVIIYYPMLSMLNEWFVKRRGLAYGLM